MGKIILLNGPPSSGKDTAAKHIRQIITIPNNNAVGQRATFLHPVLDRMSMPIKRAFAGTMGLPITPE
jgi:tRNA uridine 5-carbamoylmethylation protein Kti12